MSRCVDVIGYFGAYKIYDCGCVFSSERINDKKHQKFGGHYLKSFIQESGHHRVSLCLNGKVNRFLVSRLVAIHFIPNPSNLPVVRHKDDNPHNNHYSNLEWGTHKDNSTDMVKRNRQAFGAKNGMYGKRGKNSPSSKLVINTENGVFYDSISEAAESLDYDVSYLAMKVRGRRKNNTPIKLA